jgi:23S rRNA (uracil1939-C5)-methyltransferase
MRLTIEKLVFGGNGLCRTPEGVVLVEGVLPGEVVEAEITSRQGGVPLARVRQILQPSPHRQTPPCPCAESCGGCDWQHIAYDEQVAIKRSIFIESLQRIGKLREEPAVQVFTSPPWGYRLRTQFKLDWRARAMGFFRRSSNTVTAPRRCPLLVEPLNQLLEKQAGIFARIRPGTPQLKAIAGDDGVIASAPIVDGLTNATTVLSVGQARFLLDGDSFFQSNTFLLHTMATWAQPWVGGEYFIDMFGGAGFFSVLLGGQFKDGLLVETIDSLAQQAAANFARNDRPQLQAMAMSAERFFQNRKMLSRRPDCVIIDPPRGGMSQEVLQGLARLSPPQILYISCNPSTQARDIKFLRETAGYTITQAALFDCYPQTHHLETGLLLQH